MVSLAEIELNRQRVELLFERDRLLARNAELERDRDAAIARAECDGSFERQGKESHKAAMAALRSADPTVAYESPAQVIGWLQVQLAKAQDERERLHVRSACAVQLAMDLRAERDRLELQCAAMLAALEFYAQEYDFPPKSSERARLALASGAGAKLLAEHEKQITKLRDEITARWRQEKGEVWYWAGDDEDHLESLTCPILISAERLRNLLADHAAELDRLRGVDLANRALCEWQKEARAALKRYGRHLDSCLLKRPMYPDERPDYHCTCGFDAALNPPGATNPAVTNPAVAPLENKR